MPTAQMSLYGTDGGRAPMEQLANTRPAVKIAIKTYVMVLF